MRVDGESAEAVADVLQRFGHQGVSLEQDGIPPDTWDEDEVPPPENLILRAYFLDDHDFPGQENRIRDRAWPHAADVSPARTQL